MIVVDNTVLSNFARVGRFDLLQLATAELDPHITPAIDEEFRSGLEAGLFIDTDLQWLEIAELTDTEQASCQQLSQELDRGEAEAKAIALSRGWALATDDMKARRRMPTLFDTTDVAYVKALHRQYLSGEFSLRGMAKRLGLTYRELYTILEELGLPLTGSPEHTDERK